MVLTSSFGSLRKLINRASSDEISDFDIFYQLTYMSAVAASGISRTRIFQLGAALARPPSEFFRRVHLLAQRLGYDYASACRVIGESASAEKITSLLIRMSDALSSGQPEANFLAEEAHVQGEAYEKQYERDLTSLTKWTDAYAAINISASLIVIVNLLSTLIYDFGTKIVVGLVITAIATSILGAWILSKAAPPEIRVLLSSEGPGIQRWTRKAARLTPMVLVPVLLLMVVLRTSVGYIFIVTGIILLPLGVLSLLAGRQIDKKDMEIGAFLRTLGTMAVSTGTTLTEAITRVDLTSFPGLGEDLERLRWRLNAAIEPEICWKHFAIETGSKLITETIRVFNDAVNLGGDPDRVAFLAAEFAQKSIMLRAKRNVVASTFSWLVIVMHGALAVLMVLVLQIIFRFTSLVQKALTGETKQVMNMNVLPLPTFGQPHMHFLRNVTVLMIITLTVVNAYAIISVDGGHKYKMSFYLALLLILSGVGFVVVPPLVRTIL